MKIPLYYDYVNDSFVIFANKRYYYINSDCSDIAHWLIPNEAYGFCTLNYVISIGYTDTSKKDLYKLYPELLI